MVDKEEKNRPNCEQILVDKTLLAIKMDHLTESSTYSILKTNKFFIKFIEKKSNFSNITEIQT
jgi:hypothetical protein